MERNQSDDCLITKYVSPDDTVHSSGSGGPSSMAKRKSEIKEEVLEKKPKRQPREVVDSLQLSTLVSSYNVHFAAYSEGRTKVTQVIPNAVWKLVYGDYIKTYPQSTLKEFNLKDHVRETLNELEIGNSNEKNSETATLQSSSVLSNLKLTDGHAKRNILTQHNKIIESTAKKSSPNALPAGKIESDASQDPDVTTQKSKHTMMSEQVDAITSISMSLESSASTRGKLATAKLSQLELKNLKELCDLGVITEDEFCIKARDLFQL